VPKTLVSSFVPLRAKSSLVLCLKSVSSLQFVGIFLFKIVLFGVLCIDVISWQISCLIHGVADAARGGVRTPP
jgi:hypothetical protein